MALADECFPPIAQQLDVLYILNPVDPWSWGYLPNQRALSATFGEQLTWRVVVDDRPINPIPGVAPATSGRHGMPIAAEPLEADVTKLALLVKAASRLGELAGAKMLYQLQRALFVDHQDLNQEEPVVQAIVSSGFDVGHFFELLNSQQTLAALLTDREVIRGFGLSHSPAIAYRFADERQLLVGWHPASVVVPLGEVATLLAVQARNRCLSPGNILDYLTYYGETPAVVLGTVFGVGPTQIRAAVEELERSGAVQREHIAGTWIASIPQQQ